jgi:UTP--glucose-1-phosphate uridylyltransferase
MSVLVYTESENGSFKKTAFEVVSYAKAIATELGTTLTAVSINASNTSQLGVYGALGSIRNLIENNQFSFTRQNQMLGLGHAILSGERLIGDNPFAVVLADDLCFGEENGEGVLAQMTKLYNQFRCSIVAIQEVPPEETNKYGVIAGDSMKEGLYRITDMVEKPKPEDAPTNLAIIGRYILTPDIFDIIRNTPPGKNGEVQITDALLTQAKSGCVLAYQFKGKRFDCGSIDGFVEATNYVYNNIYKKTGNI